MPRKRKTVRYMEDLVIGVLYRATYCPDLERPVLIQAEARGRPRQLSPAEARMAQHWNAQGWSQRKLAKHYGVGVRAIRTALGAP